MDTVLVMLKPYVVVTLTANVDEDGIVLSWT